MGLFSSSYKTVVGTSGVRAISDPLLPDSARDGALKAILQGGDIPEEIISAMSGSIGLKADQCYRYAGTSDYPMGLPTGEFLSSTWGADETQVVLQNLHGGASIDFEYFLFGPANLLHTVRWLLQELWDYHEGDNTLLHNGLRRNLKDITLFLRAGVGYNPAVLDMLGPIPNAEWEPLQPGPTPDQTPAPYYQPPQFLPELSEELGYVEVFWPSGLIDNPYTVESFEIPLGAYTTDDDYVMAYYTVGGVRKYWSYRIGAGTHPTLDALANYTPTENGNFFPFIHFRSGKQGLAGVEGQPGYKQSNDYLKSKKMAKKLGLNYDQVMETIEENPDVGDVEQAYMMFAVPANSDDPVEARYLYDFFDKYYGAMLDDPDTLPSYLTGTPNGGIFIQDTKVKMQFFAYEIDKDVSNGVIGPVGTYDVLLTEGPVNYGGYTRTEQIYYYRYQHTPTQHRFIKVTGLGMHYLIAGQYAEAVIDDFRVILVPVDRSISETYGMRTREKLYSRSLHFIFNSVQVIKVKWYQQFWFQFVMLVVRVVLAAYSLGTSEGYMAMIEAGFYTIAAAIIIEQIVISILIQYAFQLFAKVAGAEVATILAIALAAYTVVALSTAPDFTAALPNAMQLLQVANGLRNAAMGVQMEEIMEDFSDLAAMREKAEEEIKRGQELLEQNNHLSPFVIFGETPDNYFNRTVHSGNIGTIGFDMLHEYVATALTLPTIAQTLSESIFQGENDDLERA